MATVGDFLKFLNAPQNQLSPVALTFKNYFQYLYDPQEELEIDALQSFIDSALTYPHWQQNRKDLHEEGLGLLNSFLGATEATSLAQALDWPQDQQIFEVDRPKTALEILNNYWAFRLKHEGAKFRLIEGEEKTYLAIILHSDQRLTVRQYDHRFVVRNGHLEPLRRDLMLVYNSNLELDPTIMHKFEISPFTVARFYREETGIHGNAVRGYVFQHLQNFHGQQLENIPRLFFALKRIEQNFVRRDTDPYYIQLVESLERLLHWMRLGEPIQPAQLHESLLKAQTALEEVFHGDKMLTLLLRDLEHLTARQQLQEPAAWPRKPNPSPSPLISQTTNRTGPKPVLKASAQTAPKPAPQKAMVGFASIRPSRTQVSPRAATPTASLKKAPSPSTAKKSTNLESKWTPTKTKSWSEENL